MHNDHPLPKKPGNGPQGGMLKPTEEAPLQGGMPKSGGPASGPSGVVPPESTPEGTPAND